VQDSAAGVPMTAAAHPDPAATERRRRRKPVTLPEERLEHIRVFVALAAQSMQGGDQRTVVPTPPQALHTTARSTAGRRAAPVSEPERLPERPVRGKRARRAPQASEA
jgi:hypothetical protein